MFPKPKCPFCGQTFESTAEAIQHLDQHELIFAVSGDAHDPEDTPHILRQEAEDPSRTVEEAG